MEDDSEGGLDYEDGLGIEGVLDDGEVLDELAGPNDKDPVTPIKTVSDHMKAISQPRNSPMAARTLEDIARISAIRREASDPIRSIQSNKRLQNLHHTQEIQKKISKTNAAAKLKKAIEDHSLAHPDPPVDKINKVNGNSGYCQPCRQHHPPKMCNHLTYPDQCPTDKPDHITVFAYGAAESGIGSRISGHLRWGGNWMRQELLRQGLVVALTDEYCTSKTCVYCFERLKLQKSRRLVGTEIKTKTVHGSVVCVNPECPAVQAGYAARLRDTNAAVGILLSAASVMLNEDEDAAPWPLLPYSRHARPRGVPTINTGAQDPDNEQTSHEQMGDTSAIVDTAGQGQTTSFPKYSSPVKFGRDIILCIVQEGKQSQDCGIQQQHSDPRLLIPTLSVSPTSAPPPLSRSLPSLSISTTLSPSATGHLAVPSTENGRTRRWSITGRFFAGRGDDRASDRHKGILEPIHAETPQQCHDGSSRNGFNSGRPRDYHVGRNGRAWGRGSDSTDQTSSSGGRRSNFVEVPMAFFLSPFRCSPEHLRETIMMST
ncbi:MAG: hypothetical protein J3Q66DRAFT_417376 [Benniella sp.]|nr:MAG: hypothetical protein J3Q66DRAFT_417376 [Benniella sp.]